MNYRIIDTAPKALMRARVYTNKRHAYVYAKALRRTLPLGYEVHIDTFDIGYHSYVRLETLNTIGKSKETTK